MNNYQILNTIHYINGCLNTDNGNVFSLNGCDKLIIPNYAEIIIIKVMFESTNFYELISLKKVNVKNERRFERPTVIFKFMIKSKISMCFYTIVRGLIRY